MRRLDLASGAPAWSVTVAGACAGASIEVDVTGPPGAAVVAVQATAATPDGATSHSVLDAADGRVLHAAEGDGPLSVDATSDLVVAGSSVAGTVAVDRATGQPRWQTPEGIELSGGRLIIETVTGPGDAAGLPADAAGTGGEASGAVQVLDPASGSPVWELARPSFSEASVVGDLLVLTQDRSGETDTVTGYDAATGAQRWQSHSVPTVGRPGVRLPAQATLGVVVGAANRDPATFERPADFDIARPRQPHLGFGSGVHLCAGHWAARISIGEIAVPLLYERLPTLRTDPRRSEAWFGWVFRGLTDLPVTW